ncbi:hypothetical protein MUU53_06245 [Rhizobium lemnae]|uniref:Uncharacterized protein n=1 Tax=Rhizobium lemnae TaxID=1214924 RepID=A0ABV8E4Z1_9HYPH|nr:hypothetical protein [Rhizobium lemnae]MCJ8507512.1 hypothetical protein [Rhizobium lemnae]
MQIDSGMNGYGYSARPYKAERKAEEALPQTTETSRISLSGITGSSTLLSSSLANALWAVEGAKTGDEPPKAPAAPLVQTGTHTVSQIEDIYSEF